MSRRSAKENLVLEDTHGAQEIGQRSSQQDVFSSSWLPSKNKDEDDPSDRLLMVLADGMGGHVGGREAAIQAVNAFFGTVAEEPLEDSQALLFRGLHAARNRLPEVAKDAPELSEMGTTLLAVLVERHGAEFIYSMVSVGDSPLWHFRADTGELIRANAEHSLFGQLAEEVKKGTITPQAAENDPRVNMGHVLTSALMANTSSGVEVVIDSTKAPRALASGDLIILASDGLDTLTPEELRDELADLSEEKAETPKIAERLLAAVKAKGLPHQDNVSVVMAAPGRKLTAPRKKLFGFIPIG